MVHYLMRLIEAYGDRLENYTYHVIEAKNRQMVKYHYHYTLKDRGYNTADWGDKHSLDSWDMGQIELDMITELNHVEYDVLSDYLHEWHKEANY